MNATTSITITPVRVADLLAEGERMPVYVHVIDHPDARVLVDTGMTELHPAVADLDPRLRPLSAAGLRPRRHRHRRQHPPALRPLRRQPPLRRQADLRPASGARRRAQRGRLHHSRVGRCARRAVRAGRRRARAASRAPARPGAGPHTRHAGGRRRDRRAAGRRRRRRGGLVRRARRAAAPKASCGCARSTPSWSGSRTSTSRGDPAPSRASRRRSMCRRCRGARQRIPSHRSVVVWPSFMYTQLCLLGCSYLGAWR